jgi:hypothetical protein
MSLLGLLVTLILFALVASIVWWIIDTLNPREPIRKILLVCLGLIALIWVISLFGAFGDGHRYLIRI